MSDRLTLSCWLNGYHALNMSPHWERLLELFPYSRLSLGLSVVRLLAVDLNEPVVGEHGFAPPFDWQLAAQMTRSYQHEDCAWQLDCSWDLMRFDETWQLGPVGVTLWCFAPRFDNETGDHLRIEFGLEDTFLPRPGDAASVRAAHANLRSLTRLVEEIRNKLPVERLHLWSESGINFAERLEQAAGRGGTGLALQ